MTFTGTIADYGILSFGENSIIPTVNGGILVPGCKEEFNRGFFLATGAMEPALWQQIEEPGYDSLMGEIIAGQITENIGKLEENIQKKKEIYKRYAGSLDGDLMSITLPEDNTEPNYSSSCIFLEEVSSYTEKRSETEYSYKDMHGVASPMKIYDRLSALGMKSRPIYKPLSIQPLFSGFDQVSLDGKRSEWNPGKDGLNKRYDQAMEYYECGLCLPSDINMTEEEQIKVIEAVLGCFNG